MTEQKFLKDLENKLWKTADTLRSNISAAEYKHVVLGLVFVKYVSDSFETRRSELKMAFANPEHEYFLGEDADDEFINEELENRDYYTEKNVFWVPQSARWKFIQDNAGLSVGAKLPNGDEFKGIGKFIDDAMEAIEKENPKLKRILNKSYAKLDIDPSKLVALVNLIAEIPFTHNSLKSKDILGHVYEYFLGKFAAAEGQRGGQFYTPKSIVNLIVQMIEPYSGRIYDPAMGSGGFFISSEKFIEAHNGRLGDISVYGQESNPTTWRLAAMNMAIRGIDFNFGKEPRSSFTSDQHPDLRADFVLANPPFNQKEEDWWDASLENDARWNGYPTPPKGNANFAWMLHMLYHSDPSKGVVGLVLANGSLSSTTNNEGEIRKAIVQNDLVEAIVALPSQLFANTQIPACIWILNRNKKQKGKTLFIDAREFGYMIDRKQRDFDTNDIKTIADMFHHFRDTTDFENIAGKYYAATTEEIAKQEYILTPGRYVGTEEVEDDGVPFKEKMDELTATLSEQFKESARLEAMIKRTWRGLGMSSKILFGDIAKFSNGKSSPDRDEKAKFNVYGSNGIIGKSDETNAKEETIIIGRVGSYCGSVYFSKDKCWVTDNAIKCEAKDNNVPSFIYYQALVLNLNNFRVGSGQPLLNQGILNNLEINYIKPKQQQKIAHILSTLDDKIELNRKMNQTLEEMASAIFKSWFVDFDPVHVKLTCKDEEELENAAKELGISKEILDLFPSEFEESELGMIPKGWEVKKAGEITNTFDYVANGSFASLKENVTLYDEPNDILYVRTTDFNNGFKGSLKYTDKKSYEFLKKSKLLGHETVISNVADVGTVFRAPVWLGLPMTLGSNAIGVVGLDNEFLDSYIFYFFKSNIGQHLIESITTGSAQLKFNKTSFRALNILLPNIEIRKIFEKQEKLIYEKMINNIAEIQTLQKTRDTLLPKLLSGEIDVSEVEV